MALSSYSTTNIRSRLGDLSIDSNDHEPRSSPSSHSTKSLLSKSLASEKVASNASRNDSFSDQMFLLSPTLSIHDHPEPEILATSVGKDSDGRLIPSSSAISLLSLNNNHHQHNSTASHPPATNNPESHPHPHPQSSNTISSTHSHMTLSSQQQHHYHPGMAERKNSIHNLRSRNSLTHLSHQRLQPYHKLQSPIAPYNSEFATIAAPQSIPLARNQSFLQNAPDSPNLIPTSIGGSPSRFWLTSQTPPKSLAGSYKSRQQLFPLTPHSQNHGNHDGQNSTRFIPLAKGAQSPILNPVQTPLEDLPMTPLYLNSEADSYFVYKKPNNQGYFPAYTAEVYREVHEEQGAAEGDSDQVQTDTEGMDPV